jgi:pyridoxal phosphate enzyme (YggS family)
MNYILDNINSINERISVAIKKSGRSPEDITLVAVTKNINLDAINIALATGIKNIGENRVQELISKYDKIERSNEVNWHLIGHLQCNKVKYIIDKVKLIHSVDSLKLADEINYRAQKSNIIMDILLEMNVSGEQSKFGFEINKCVSKISEIAKLPNIKVRGLMTIAPFSNESEKTREVFRELNEKFIDIKQKNIDNVTMDYLSMGMSNDFEIAIEEGANIVRIGSAIFGERVYT